MPEFQAAVGPSLGFLAGAGEMAGRTRSHDWSASPLGEPATWPQPLCSALSICLSTPVVCAVHWGPDLRTFYNDAYAPALAERHPSSLGQPLTEVWHEIWDVVGPQIAQVLETGKGFATEEQLLRMHRNGRWENTYWIYSYAPILQNDGTIGGIFVTGVDTTEKIVSERLIAAASERQLKLFQNAPGFMAIVNGPQHVFEFVNEAYQRLIGKRDLVGKSVRNALPELEGQPFFGLLDKVFASGERYSAEHVPILVERKPGAAAEERIIDFVYQPIVDDQGAVTGIFCEGHDVTDAHRAQADLSDLNAHLEERVAAAIAARDVAATQLRQSQKLEAIGQLTGGVAHDFNNLLTVIRGSIDLLKRPDLSDERREKYINAISDTVTRATRLTAQLLAFARRQALKPVVFNVGESLGTITEMLGTLAGSRIAIEANLPSQACFISADPNQFETALVNMAINARDAMNGRGRLIIAVRPVEDVPSVRSHPPVKGPFVAIALTDTGTGISPDKLDEVFEPFFTTKGVGQGTGLGLSQVFGFVKQSGGEVHVESELGVGSTFTLYLPRVDAGQFMARDDDGAEALIDGKGACILVVEDNSEVGLFADQALKELGYNSVLATSAEDALAKLSATPGGFDVVFTDVVMPGMNGIELGQAVRELYPELPVILASGYSSVLAEEGTHGFVLLQKPYSIDELSRVLAKAATIHTR